MTEPRAAPIRSAAVFTAALALGVSATALAWWAGSSEVLVQLWSGIGARLGHSTRHDLNLIACGMLLAAAAPRQSGLQIGRIRDSWRGVLLVCGVPVLLTAIVYPQLPERPFSGAGASMWTLSPFGQDLLFAGVLYGWLTRILPGPVHRNVPVDRALVLTAACFAGWHLQNLGSAMSSGYLAFQLLYTAVGFVLTGLSRQWTGSILYLTLSHSAVNWIAWRFS